MSITLYQSTVISYLQIIPSILRCLDKGRKFCLINDIDRNEYVNASLYTGMLSLHFQVIALVHFSEGALNGARDGVIAGPDMTLAFSYDNLQHYLEKSLKRIEKWKPDDINTLSGGEVLFKYNEMVLPFSTEDFFCTYATPHFYFRATLIYSILRSKGVPVGIADYIGIEKTTQSSHIPSDKRQYSGEEYLQFLHQLAGP